MQSVLVTLYLIIAAIRWNSAPLLLGLFLAEPTLGCSDWTKALLAEYPILGVLPLLLFAFVLYTIYSTIEDNRDRVLAKLSEVFPRRP
jgi:hypothetical protein